MSDWESHRVLTRTGRFRGLVFTYLSGRIVFKRRINDYATGDSFFNSLSKLETHLRKRGWKLKKVNHFS